MMKLGTFLLRCHGKMTQITVVDDFLGILIEIIFEIQLKCLNLKK